MSGCVDALTLAFDGPIYQEGRHLEDKKPSVLAKKPDNLVSRAMAPSSPGRMEATFFPSTLTA